MAPALDELSPCADPEMECIRSSSCAFHVLRTAQNGVHPDLTSKKGALHTLSVRTAWQ